MKKHSLSQLSLFICMAPALFCRVAPAATSHPRDTTVFVEAEAPQPAEARWAPQELAGASAGKVLFLRRNERAESADAPLRIPRAGRYRIWVRYYRSAPTSPGFFVLLRDEQGAELAFHFCDFYTPLPTETPYRKPTPVLGGRTGFVWEYFDAVFERPVTAALCFGVYPTGGGKYGGGVADRQIDCLLLTTDLKLDPQKRDVAELPRLATPLPQRATALPAGFVAATGLPARTDFYSPIADPRRRFQAGLINNGSYFFDVARAVRMGFNRDHANVFDSLAPHGVMAQGHVESFRGNTRELAKKYPSPTGRFVNAQGVVGNVFSFNFPPLTATAASDLEGKVQEYLAQKNSDAIGNWRITDESGGLLDYSPDAVAAFRKWLEAKHGTIEVLNRRWGTAYKSFEEITPPASFEEGRAAWLEFRAFSGHSYAEAVARQMPVLDRVDPAHRPRMGANSNLDLFSPYFSRIRPIDFDELIHTALAGESAISWDTYCADDQLASETDLLTSMADFKKRVVVQEWSNHAVDPRIAARSYWSFVSKGAAGVFLFMFQEGFHPTYPKWALLDENLAPKAKLAAYSDAVQEVHRLEPLLMNGRYTHAVKPIALYWSRIDLSLADPHESLYGCALDSPFHIYATLRGLGYPVRWITPRQIEAGDLANVGALVLADSNHIPEAAAGKIEQWVRGGGVAIGDQWPGAWNEYAQPQSTLSQVFGVRSAAKKTGPQSGIALEESRQGYGEVTDAAIVRKNYYEKVDEVAQQPYATHPVARAIGDFMLSGISLDRVECFSGHVIGMSHRGVPGLVVNEYGWGKTLYSAMLLGTIYESSGTRYEWDTTHAGLSYARILDAFLKYSGVRPGSVVSGLAPRVRAKLRVESPIVTPQGNVFVGITSMNDDEVKPFDLQVELPPGARGPFTKVFMVREGRRTLQPVAAKVEGSRLHLQLPGLDTRAAVIALKDFEPLIGLQLNAPRGEAGLAVPAPGRTYEVKATIYNPSPRRLAPGELSLTLPAGWLQSARTAKPAAIAPGGQATCSFKVRTPDLAASRRILPLVARYRSGAVRSTPATEMVWWGTTASG